MRAMTACAIAFTVCPAAAAMLAPPAAVPAFLPLRAADPAMLPLQYNSSPEERQ